MKKTLLFTLVVALTSVTCKVQAVGDFTTIDRFENPSPLNLTQIVGISGNDIVGWWLGGAVSSFIYDGSSYTPINPPNALNGGAQVVGVLGTTIYGSFADSNGIHRGRGFSYNNGEYTIIDHPNAGIYGTHFQGFSGNAIYGGYSDNDNAQYSFAYDGNQFYSIKNTGVNRAQFPLGVNGNNFGSYVVERGYWRRCLSRMG
jgi:hypothetical protein